MPPKRQASSNVSPTLAKMEARGGRPAGPSGPSLISKLSTELVGTALLTLTVGAAAGQGSKLAAVGIGSTLMCAVYAGAHISGANYNPAVTLAIFVRGKLGFMEAILYMLTQLFGGFARLRCARAGAGMGHRVIQLMVAPVGVRCRHRLPSHRLRRLNLLGHLRRGHRHLCPVPYGAARGDQLGAGRQLVLRTGDRLHRPLRRRQRRRRLGRRLQPRRRHALLRSPRGRSLSLRRTARRAQPFRGGDGIERVGALAGPLAGGLLAGLLFRLTHPSQCGDVSAVCRVPGSVSRRMSSRR